jgi:hypothetical protein
MLPAKTLHMVAKSSLTMILATKPTRTSGNSVRNASASIQETPLPEDQDVQESAAGLQSDARQE